MAVRKDLEEVKNESFASEILSDYKKDKKRLFIIKPIGKIYEDLCEAVLW